MPPGKVDNIMCRFPVNVLVILAETSDGAAIQEVSAIGDTSDIVCKTLLNRWHIHMTFTQNGRDQRAKQRNHEKIFWPSSESS